MAVGESTATIGTPGDLISTYTVDEIDGVTVSEREVERVLLSFPTASGKARTVDATHGFPVNMVEGSFVFDPEARIGQVGGNTRLITPTITVSTSASPYTIGDVIGGEITLTAALRITSGSGVIQSLVVETANGAAPALSFLFFDSNPAANTANHAAFAWGTGDSARFLGKIDVAAADFATIGGYGIATKTGTGLVMVGNGSADLYMQIVAVTVPTIAASSDLKVRVGILAD